MKITHSTDKITTFGGFNFCRQIWIEASIDKLIDDHLGQQVQRFGFNYLDILINHLAIFLNGGDCIEDILGYLQEEHWLSACSTDTLLRDIKELSTPIQQLISPHGVKHQFNFNRSLSSLLLRVLKMTGKLRNQQSDTLDFDNQEIATEK